MVGIMDSMRQLLEEAKLRRSEAAQELASLDAIVAALELASQEVPALNGQGGSETDSGALNQRGKRQRRRAVRHRKRRAAPARRGEMRKAVLSALAHYDGRPVPTGVLVRYITRHRPASLKRKEIDDRSMAKRVSCELYRMVQSGDLVGERAGRSMNWTVR